MVGCASGWSVKYSGLTPELHSTNSGQLGTFCAKQAPLNYDCKGLSLSMFQYDITLIQGQLHQWLSVAGLTLVTGHPPHDVKTFPTKAPRPSHKQM